MKWTPAKIVHVFVAEVSQLPREFLIYQAEPKPGPGEPVLICSAPGKPGKLEQGPRRNSRRSRDTCYTGTCHSTADYPWHNKQSQFRAIFALCSILRWVYLTKSSSQMFHSVWVGDNNTFKVTVIFLLKHNRIIYLTASSWSKLTNLSFIV